MNFKEMHAISAVQFLLKSVMGLMTIVTAKLMKIWLKHVLQIAVQVSNYVLMVSGQAVLRSSPHQKYATV
tara:strand:+ start:105 stop:314 length:210 start_codon:yes stop_codon:yes gene_type:complete